MIEFSTPSGYQVHLKDFLDTKGYRAIQRATVAQTEIHAGMTAQDITIQGSAGLDAEEVALQQLLVHVTLPDQSVAPDPVAAVGAMPFQDGQAVYARVNALTAEVSAEDAAKNASAVSSTI
jgi:hypothetical protein